MNAPNRLVCVLEDDAGYRRALLRMLEAAGHTVRAFGSVEELVAAIPDIQPGCLVLDVRLPGASGLDLQETLARMGWRLPIVFLTGHGDIPMSVQAMRAGAVDFLTKPAPAAVLLKSIERALAQGLFWEAEDAEVAGLVALRAALTPREREVFGLIAQGMMNKEVAARLGTTERTIKAHRAQVMAKMKAATLADIVRAAERLERRDAAELPAAE